MGNYTGNYTGIWEAIAPISNVKIVQGEMLNSVILSILIVIASFIAATVVHFILEKIVAQFTKKTKTKVDDLIVEKTKYPFYLLVIFVGIRIALVPLIIPEALEKILVEIDYSILIIIIFFIIGRSFNIVIDEWGKKFAKKSKSQMDEQLLSVFHKFLNVFFIILTVIFILQQWGVKVTPFLASLGIAGIAVAFALQSTLANILGGIQLIVDRTMEAGDTVKVGNDIFGTVVDIGIRSTRIRTLDNEILIVPNGQLSNMTIQNFAQPEPMVRVVVDFGTEYGSDPKKVKKTIEDAVKSMKVTLKEPAPEVVFISMGDFALNFQARFWVDSYTKRFDAKVEATNMIYETLRKHNIGIPFPTRTVYIKKED